MSKKQAEPSAHRDNAREDALNEGMGEGRKEQVQAPQLGFKGMLRWAWTQLTSMRTALMLLLLLAIAAVPGSLFPQRVQDAFAVQTWIEDNPTIGPILDSLQFFDVYSSFWFSSIYLLLFISLIGCIIPRAKKHYQHMTSPPPRTPRNLQRLPEYGALELSADGPDAETALADAQKVLKSRRYRSELRPATVGASGATGKGSIGAEKGYLKEIGNLVFHLSLIGVLIFVAAGALFSYRGQKILTEDEAFVNTLVAYDNFYPGSWFHESELDPFSVRLNDFERVFDRQLDAQGQPMDQYGQALGFTADVTVQDGLNAEPVDTTLRVNEPLSLGGAQVYLVGNGYAPIVTVRDGEGEVAYSGPVITRPDDPVYTSMAVIKAPDAAPEQLGFVGLFLPSAYDSGEGLAVSVDPELNNPELHLNAYAGDLGLDEGIPQNVYVLDTEDMQVLNSREIDAGGIVLSPGETHELPNDMGELEFEGVQDYIAMDISYNPGELGVLIFALTATTGLVGSLFLRRRRVWVTTETTEAGRTLVSYGMLSRGEDFSLRDENIALRKQFEKIWPVLEPETGTSDQETLRANGRGDAQSGTVPPSETST